MLICSDENCMCVNHRRLLECIKEGADGEASSLQLQLQNVHELTDAGVMTLFLLHYAVNCGNLTMVQYLIEVGYAVDAHDNCGDTPLMLAVRNDDVDIIEILLNNNANIYAADDSGINSVQLAIQMSFNSNLTLENGNKYSILIKLFDQLSTDLSISDNQAAQLLLNADESMALAAVVFGNEELARFMLENVYVDICEIVFDYTPLHWAIILARVANAKVLIEHGAPVDALDAHENSPLFYYAPECESEDNESELLKSLLKRSADSYSSQVERELTDMEWLLMHGNVETVRTALRSVNDISACLSSERSLVNLLVENENDDVLDVIEEFDVKVCVNAHRADGKTALMAAAEKGSVKKVELLLKHGADVNLVTYTGHSALYFAITPDLTYETRIVQRNFINIVQILLQHEADAQLIFRNGRSFIECLCSCDNAFSNKILAHLALLAKTNESALTARSREEITSRAVLKNLFDFYSQQLEDTKYDALFGTVTFYEMVSQSKTKISGHARNRQSDVVFGGTMEQEFHFTPHYNNTWHKWMENTENKAGLVAKAAFDTETLTASRVHSTKIDSILFLNLPSKL